jgi:hypothetical protein
MAPSKANNSGPRVFNTQKKVFLKSCSALLVELRSMVSWFKLSSPAFKDFSCHYNLVEKYSQVGVGKQLIGPC